MRVIVNGVEKDTQAHGLSYEDVSRLAWGKVVDGLTVTYSAPGGAGGTLTPPQPGSRPSHYVMLQPGMVFNALQTNNA